MRISSAQAHSISHIVTHHRPSVGRLGCLALAVVVAAGAGCATTQDAKETGPTPVDFYPLAIGNAWVYEITSPGSETITDRIAIESKDAEGFYVDSKGAKVKARKDGIFDGQRFLLEAPIEIGHKWLAVPGPTEVERYEIVGVMERVKVKAGPFDDCIRVRGTQETHMQNGTPATLSTEWTWAPGVGLIRMRQSVTIGATPPVDGISIELLEFVPVATEAAG